jgi:hypothetical protein
LVVGDPTDDVGGMLGSSTICKVPGGTTELGAMTTDISASIVPMCLRRVVEFEYNLILSLPQNHCGGTM